MENLDMIRFNDNGQAFFDWDALEFITSKEFVDGIKLHMDSKTTIVSVIKGQLSVEVLVNLNHNQLGLFKFWNNHNFILTHFFNIYDVERYAAALGGEIKWQK